MVVEWDERNLKHLLVENGHRGISPEEVTEVILDPATEKRRLRTRRRRYRGATRGGRRLTVVVEVLSPGCVRPTTAWETPQ